MHAVKLEGGGRMVEITRRLTELGIPVMGHLGLTPQFVHQMGGFKVQGKTETQAARILADARTLEEAGAFSIVLEGVPSRRRRHESRARCTSRRSGSAPGPALRRPGAGRSTTCSA